MDELEKIRKWYDENPGKPYLTVSGALEQYRELAQREHDHALLVEFIEWLPLWGYVICECDDHIDGDEYYPTDKNPYELSNQFMEKKPPKLTKPLDKPPKV